MAVSKEPAVLQPTASDNLIKYKWYTKLWNSWATKKNTILVAFIQGKELTKRISLFYSEKCT